ncbi:MAG: type II toxin-antitoxin system HicA family toxin [Bacteroidales bacterium]|nr:type II toxin-antitoxin system HicA family toxin [Bacteroidales bacterium]
MKYSELRKILRQSGCTVVRQGANHEIWYSSKTRRHFPVARHNADEVYTGTLRDIVKQSGIKI